MNLAELTSTIRNNINGFIDWNKVSKDLDESDIDQSEYMFDNKPHKYVYLEPFYVNEFSHKALETIPQNEISKISLESFTKILEEEVKKHIQDAELVMLEFQYVVIRFVRVEV